jgi:hypothetical protein
MEEIAIVRSELVRQQKDARSTIYRGVLLIAMVPVVVVVAVITALFLGGVPSVIAILAGAVYALIGGVAGVGTIIAGGLEYRRLGKQVHDYDHVRHLPEARLIERRAESSESRSVP